MVVQSTVAQQGPQENDFWAKANGIEYVADPPIEVLTRPTGFWGHGLDQSVVCG